jgi:hypothetical protein
VPMDYVLCSILSRSSGCVQFDCVKLCNGRQLTRAVQHVLKAVITGGSGHDKLAQQNAMRGPHSEVQPQFSGL